MNKQELIEAIATSTGESKSSAVTNPVIALRRSRYSLRICVSAR
jgi:hypothetical protein